MRKYYKLIEIDLRKVKVTFVMNDNTRYSKTYYGTYTVYSMSNDWHVSVSEASDIALNELTADIIAINKHTLIYPHSIKKIILSDHKSNKKTIGFWKEWPQNFLLKLFGKESHHQMVKRRKK